MQTTLPVRPLPTTDHLLSFLAGPARLGALESLTIQSVQAATSPKQRCRSGSPSFQGKSGHSAMPFVATKRALQSLTSPVFEHVDALLDVRSLPRPEVIFASEEAVGRVLNLAAGHSSVPRPALSLLRGAGRLFQSGVGYALPASVNHGLSAQFLEKLAKYDPQNKRIVMRPMSTARGRMYLAHEYTHHVQTLMLPDHFWAAEALLEGHALGVQRLFVLEDSNPEAKQEWFDLEARLLAAAYLMACTRAETHPSPLVTDERVDPLFRVPHHAIGLAVFRLALERRGPGVLCSFLRGEAGSLAHQGGH